MGFKGFLGIVCLLFSLWLWFGEPGESEYGEMLGAPVKYSLVWLSEVRPFSTILVFISGVALLVTVKKP